MPDPVIPNSNLKDLAANLPHADLKLLKRRVANPATSDADRERTAKAIESIEWYLQWQSELEKLAIAIGIDEWCRELDYEILAHLNAELMREERWEDTQIGIAICADLDGYQDSFSPSPMRGFQRLVGIVIEVALTGEMDRRQRENENKAGRAIRGMLVEETERSKRLTKLAKWAASRLSFPEQPGEEQSIAVGALWEQIAPLAEVSPVAANPEALQAFMRGSLNKILRHVHDHLRTLIETEGRRSELRVEEPASHLDEDRDEPFIEGFPDKAQREPYQKLLVERTIRKLPKVLNTIEHNSKT